ncbi:MAG: hypothetical protein ACPGVT_12460 [Maricaulaceae bacterium]
MPYADVSKFYKRLLLSKHKPRRALALAILMASRGHMVRHATWDEFDLKNGYWTIPAARMKRSAEDYTISLTKSMIELLPELTNGLVFPYRGKCISINIKSYERAFYSTWL